MGVSLSVALTLNWCHAKVRTPVSSAPSSAIDLMSSKIEAMWYGGRGPLWLLPLSFLYGGLMGLRSLLYRMGLRHQVRMKVPVVVVGNLTVGGTGKTPLVAWLSTHLAAVGLRV